MQAGQMESDYLKPLSPYEKDSMRKCVKRGELEKKTYFLF